MSLILSTTSGTGANLSSELAIGAQYAATTDALIGLSFRLSNLNGAAAVFTIKLRHFLSNGTTKVRDFGPYYRSKPTAADTVDGDMSDWILLKSGEKLEFRIVSSNASDTNVTWERNVFDAAYPVQKVAATIASGDVDLSALATMTALNLLSTAISNLQSSVTNIQNNTRVVLTVPDQILVPESGSQTYKVHLYLYDEAGAMETADSEPTITLINSAGDDRSNRLNHPTMEQLGQGHYLVDYTSTAGDTSPEQLLWEFTVTENSDERKVGRTSTVVDTILVSAIAEINSKLGTPAASVSADIAAVKVVADAVKNKTDALPVSPAATGAAMTLTPAERTATAGVLNTALGTAHGSGSWESSGGGTGDGDVQIDHNFGGTDERRIVDSDDIPVDNAVIRAYVAADYIAGNIDPEPPATRTGSDGRWLAPLMLDADDYKVSVYDPRTRRAKLFDLTVT